MCFSIGSSNDVISFCGYKCGSGDSERSLSSLNVMVLGSVDNNHVLQLSSQFTRQDMFVSGCIIDQIHVRAICSFQSRFKDIFLCFLSV